jgi:homoserine O-succinyltransferase
MNGMDRHIIKSGSGTSGRRVTIGLINNMSPAACSTTERQFGQILAEAGSEHDVHVRCFRTSIADDGAGLAPTEAIFEAELDGIIVTGAEPQSSNLINEPIWPLITRLVDWGEEQALPVVWSCLAAHAAVLYLDGIDRVPLERKVSGIFSGEVTVSDHPLMLGLADGWSVPHSRCNDLPEETLVTRSYQVLVRSPGAGVDLFQKMDKPAFVFLQSHPEYDADTLWREFHRDVRRFLAGERHDAPALPHSNLNSIKGTIPAFPGDWSSVRRQDAEAILAWLGRCGDHPVQAPWRPTAVTFFRNWVRGVAERKARIDDRSTEFVRPAAHSHDLQQLGLVPC